MTYRLTAEGQACSPIPGVPWRDLTDDEFAAISAAYDAGFPPDQAGSLRRFFERDPGDKSETSERRPRRPSSRGDALAE